MSGCSSMNVGKNKINYYAFVHDADNTGILNLEYLRSYQEIRKIKKDNESTHYKVFYINNEIKRIEKFQGDKTLPNKTFFINENNINYRIRYHQEKSYIDCNLTYKKKDTFRIKTTTCSDGIKEVLTTKPDRIFISYLKYDKSKNIVKKEISTKEGIEMYENGKLIEIRNEIE
jgi:hypothetical protein